MAVGRFEDLIAWQKARVLTREVYSVTRGEPFSRDFGLRDQIRRASVSVMADIAEGFERNRTAEFQRFLGIAQGSCAEVRSHLYVALDAGYLDGATFDTLLSHAAEVGRITGGLMAAAARKSDAAALGTRDSGLGTSS